MTTLHPRKKSITRPDYDVILIDMSNTLHTIYIPDNKHNPIELFSMVRATTYQVSFDVKWIYQALQIANDFNKMHTYGVTPHDRY